jgi:hypothetical protein
MILVEARGGNDPVFLYGTLTDRDVLTSVLARYLLPDELERAVLPEVHRRRTLGASCPVLVPAPGRSVSGWLLLRASHYDIIRLNHFESGEYQAERHATRQANGDTCLAWLYVGLPHLIAGPEPWDLASWQRQHKAAFLAQCEAWMADCPEPG